MKTSIGITLKRPPVSKEMLRPVDKAFIHSTMFELGIAPIEDPRLDMRRGLDQLSPEDASKMKRKFRKLWRKALRENKTTVKSWKEKTLKEVGSRYGVGKTTVSKHEKYERKRLVYESLWNKRIAPKLHAFENPSFKQDPEKT